MKFEDASLRILEYLYKEQKENGNSEEELRKINIGRNEFSRVINYLSQKGMLFTYHPYPYKYGIDANGIDYLNKQKSEKRQNEFNKIVALSGIVLAFQAINDFFIKVEVTNWFTNLMLMILYFIIIFSLMSSYKKSFSD